MEFIHGSRMLLLGQCVVSPTPAILTTILGSCVSVCLWDRCLKIGGMNHYLLPGIGKERSEHGNRGITAIQMLIDQMLERNARIECLEAKIFGGANSFHQGSSYFNAGEKNSALAVQMLREHRIAVTASHVGGSVGRRIAFNTYTGDVAVQMITDQQRSDATSIQKALLF